ncbi:HlyD family efflux transporter periplasmic adaptor subunit [Bathymodiolus septemdierum thioautotrophic gill symbiont]|uniref:HlyD family secretion protein n=1 Tax=endosymbiont of Bathymodiolus septemdierum str. Myojin knoll TaxID=1303921 RepID=A0A0P0USB5_9GAMM|nr:HlyD family efflux transporter periplasmic adaptor subunit [Bathymodiolus septemdierum thioautotrophic gill symbiont]BAS68016.1 HlyD family secretion protein [endosymbiont of Bathymodiolus septemdierum str. Myojin knoll]
MSLEKFLLKIEHSFSIVYVFLGGLVVFILWATLFDIDETIRSQGKVVANGSTQIIQVADGGVLSKLLVKEGEIVVQGQLLATLEKERAQAGYYEVRSQVAHLKSALARANAELLEKPIVFDELTQNYPDFMNAQKALYVQKKRSLNQEVSVLEESLAMSTKEWEITQSLEKTGDVGQLEVLRARQKVLDFKRKVADTKNKYYERTGTEIEKLEGELAKQLHMLKKQKSVLEYTDIHSPVSGIVKELKVTTVGGVLRSGEQLMEISPLKGGVVLELKVNPVDIGRLRLGMLATIKLDAFDYTIFGGLKGVVTYISSDTLLDKDPSGREMAFYQVNIKIEGPEHDDNEKSKLIKPKLGMSATVDIKVGERSLFTYLIKPISRGFSGALNEK